MKFERTAGNVEPVIKNVVEDELKGEDVQVNGELVESGKAVQLAGKSINLLNWLKPHSSLSCQFEAVQLILQLDELPTFVSLLFNSSLWPEFKFTESDWSSSHSTWQWQWQT